MKTQVTRRHAALIYSLILVLIALPILSACNVDSSQLFGTAASVDQTAAALAMLQSESDGALRVETYAPTGAARWVAAEGGILTRQFARQSLASEAVALSFLNTYGAIFGLSDGANALQMTGTEGDETGDMHIEFAQQQNGVPIFGTGLIVHMDAEGAVELVNGYTLPNSDTINTNPTLSAEDAAQVAIAHVAITDSVAAESYLEIFNLGLITDEATPTYLVYRIRVDSPIYAELAQWVFVDANTGEIRFAYAAVPDARNRTTYVYGRSGVVRSETTPPVTTVVGCSVTDLNNAHDFAGQAYDFYKSRFGRDSYNNAGATLRSAVCYGSRNAYWTGSEMRYSAGYAVDDVAGHELSHAVTQHISGLVYSYQSGALNESFSDIMGEALDLTNGVGDDAAAKRWDMGEQIPGGALRDMLDPTRFRFPDSTTSQYYYCAGGDNGGVHYNSGVSNKAFALMVDGGTFNGVTVSAIGLDKAVQIQYRAHNLYLTPSSKFIDAYNALNRACNELYGASSADCGNVKKALDATKMNGPVCGVAPVPQPTPGPSPTPSPVPPPPVVNGNFETGRNVGWAESSSHEVVVANVGQGASWGAYLAGGINIVSEINQSYKVAAAASTLRYAYRIGYSEDYCGYDFGYVQVNDTVLKSYVLCPANYTNGFVQGSVDLSAYAGQTVTLRFRATTDYSLTSEFFIDDVNFSPAALNEETDPYASTGPVTPEAKTADSPMNPEAQPARIFLPVVKK